MSFALKRCLGDKTLWRQAGQLYGVAESMGVAESACQAVHGPAAGEDNPELTSPASGHWSPAIAERSARDDLIFWSEYYAHAGYAAATLPPGSGRSGVRAGLPLEDFRARK
jgi:hypothetical protein